MTDPHREELILRYITGKLPSDAALRARTYLDETPRGHVVGIGLRQVMAAEILEDGAPDARTSLARLLDRLDHEIPNFPSKLADGVGASRSTVKLPQPVGTVRTEVLGRKQRMLGTQPLRRGGYAITGITLAAVALLITWKGHLLPLREHAPIAVSTYTTGNGERANITLPDGSTVALNVASRLEVPADYLTGNPTLRLTGEAAFTVTQHHGAPFTVVVGPATVQVLGTSFLVRHYAADTTAMVVVRDGKVSVHTAQARPLVLTEAREVKISQVGTQRIGPADPSWFSFMSGVLTLNDVPLSVAIPELNRWYDADIRVGDPKLAGQRITGEYAAGSLADVAAILEGTFNVRVVRSGRILTLLRR